MTAFLLAPCGSPRHRQAGEWPLDCAFQPSPPLAPLGPHGPAPSQEPVVARPPLRTFVAPPPAPRLALLLPPGPCHLPCGQKRAREPDQVLAAPAAKRRRLWSAGAMATCLRAIRRQDPDLFELGLLYGATVPNRPQARQAICHGEHFLVRRSLDDFADGRVFERVAAHGFELNFEMTPGQTPLIDAIVQGKQAAARALIKHGVNPFAPTSAGPCAALWADWLAQWCPEAKELRDLLSFFV